MPHYFAPFCIILFHPIPLFATLPLLVSFHTIFSHACHSALFYLILLHPKLFCLFISHPISCHVSSYAALSNHISFWPIPPYLILCCSFPIRSSFRLSSYFVIVNAIHSIPSCYFTYPYSSPVLLLFVISFSILHNLSTM